MAAEPVSRALEIARPVQVPGALTPADYEMFSKLAGACAMATLATSFGRSRENALISLVVGHAIGLPPGLVLTVCKVVEGNLWIPSDVLQGLAQSKVPGLEVEVVESNEHVCRLRGTRPGRKPVEASFSIEQAQRAGRVKDGSAYKNYPEDKLHAMALRRLIKRLAPEAIYGLAPMFAGEIREEEAEAATAAEPSSVEEVTETPPPVNGKTEPSPAPTERPIDRLIARLKVCGWKSKPDMLRAVNAALVDSGKAVIRNAAILSDDEADELFGYFDRRYDENGKRREVQPPAAPGPPVVSKPDDDLPFDEEPPALETAPVLKSEHNSEPWYLAINDGNREALVMYAKALELKLKRQILQTSTATGNVWLVDKAVLDACGFEASVCVFGPHPRRVAESAVSGIARALRNLEVEESKPAYARGA